MITHLRARVPPATVLPGTWHR